MHLSTLSDLRNYEGHHDIFHTKDWLMNPLAIINIENPLYQNRNGFVSDVTANVGESGAMSIRVKLKQPIKKVPTFSEMVLAEMDVIYVYDNEGNYNHSQILNRFALIKEGLDNGEIDYDFYGIPVYESKPDLKRVTKQELEDDLFISRLTHPELELNLPLNETLERRIVGLLKHV